MTCEQVRHVVMTVNPLESTRAEVAAVAYHSFRCAECSAFLEDRAKEAAVNISVREKHIYKKGASAFVSQMLDANDPEIVI